MAAEIITIDSSARPEESVHRAATALRDGALVAFRTETVYGLAANAAHGDSVDRLCAIKGRDAEKPFTLHIGRKRDREQYAPAVSPIGHRLTKKGWPGPLTLIFPIADASVVPGYSSLSLRGVEAIYSRGSIGIRCPDDAVAEALLTSAACPVVASSANFAGEPAPTEPGQISGKLAAAIDVIIDSGPTRYRKSSTIVSLNGDGYTLLRAGVWDERIIGNLASLNILFVCTGNTCRSPIAEGLFKDMAAKKLGCRVEELATRGIHIRSAGTAAYGRSRVSPEAVEVCRRRGVDISEHIARPLTLELIHPSDYIYGMARHHSETTRTMSESSSDKIARLDPERDIEDPMGGSLEEYEAAAVQIESALRKRIEEVPL